MELRIRIAMDNAAFEDNASQEAARILRKLADQIDGDRYFDAGNERHLMDINGNNVGHAGGYAEPRGSNRRPASVQSDPCNGTGAL